MSGGRRAARFANDVTRPRRRPRVSPCCGRIFSLSPLSLPRALSLSLPLPRIGDEARDGWDTRGANCREREETRRGSPYRVLSTESVCQRRFFADRMGRVAHPASTSTLARPANMAVRSLERREIHVDQFTRAGFNYTLSYRSYRSVVFVIKVATAFSRRSIVTWMIDLTREPPASRSPLGIN